MWSFNKNIEIVFLFWVCYVVVIVKMIVNSLKAKLLVLSLYLSVFSMYFYLLVNDWSLVYV